MLTRRELWMCGTLAALAVAMYAPALGWGLPHATSADRIVPWGVDELAPLDPVAELYNVFVARKPPFNPQYPLFHYFVGALFVGPYLGWLWLTGGLSAASPVYPYGLADVVGALRVMTVWARLPGLLMAGGVAALSAWIGRRLWGWREGWLAGGFVASLYSMAYYGRTANTDVPALFWTALGYAALVLVWREGWTAQRGAAVWVCAALATATKDASYLAFVAPAAALWWAHGWRRLAPGVVAGAGVYLAASGVLLNWERFADHLHFITRGSKVSAYYDAPATLAGYAGLLAQCAKLLEQNMGWPLLALAAAGCWACWKEERRLLALAALLPLTLALVILPVRFAQLRFFLPAAWGLALLAARGAGLLWERRPKLGQAAVAAALVWALAWQADLLWQSLHDTRYAAGEWMARHAKRGDRVVFFHHEEKLPPLGEGVITLRRYASEWRGEGRPEFVMVIPWQTYEIEREKGMPAEFHRALGDGRLGYRLAAHFQPRTWFGRRAVATLNPPVSIYERVDGRQASWGGFQGLGEW